MTSFNLVQYKLLYTILNNIEVYEEPVPRTKKIPHCAVRFEAGEENSIIHECLYCCTVILDGHSCMTEVKVVPICPFRSLRRKTICDAKHAACWKNVVTELVLFWSCPFCFGGAKRTPVKSGLESHRLIIVFLVAFPLHFGIT